MGFRAHGVDLDQIFDPYDAGAKPALTGYRLAGQDLRDRYNPISQGEDCGVTTNIEVGGTDLRQIFAGLGTSSQALVIGWQQYSIDSTGVHDAGGSIELELSRGGTWSITMSVLSGGTTNGTPLSGNWHAAPGASVGDDYEVRFTRALTLTGTTPPTATASTGWLSLASARSVTVNSHVHYASSGDDPHSDAHAIGHYTVEIRKVGSSIIRTSTCGMQLDAFV